MSTNPENIDLFAGLPLAQPGADAPHPAAAHLAAAAQRPSGRRRTSWPGADTERTNQDPTEIHADERQAPGPRGLVEPGGVGRLGQEPGEPTWETTTVRPLNHEHPNFSDVPPSEDLQLIDTLGGQISEIRPGRDETPDTREEVGRAIIGEVLKNYADSLLRQGQRLEQDQYDRLQRILFNNAYRLGPLQDLLDDPTVENIHILGCDQVQVRYSDKPDGYFRPIARNDEALVQMIQGWSRAREEGEREFNASSPLLSLSLPGGERLQAVHPPISERPTATIRCHRAKEITLNDLVNQNVLTQVAADMLSAAVRAHRSIVVAGMPGAGKTTFIRALCASFDPWEPVVTIETERELFLSPTHHRNLRSLEARPGKGERDTATGTVTGEVTLPDIMSASLRLDVQRIIIGEVRKDEVEAMFAAFAAAAGSMTTLHAESAQGAISRLASLQQTESGASPAFAYQQIQDHVDIIVQLARFTEGGQPRMVTEIVEVQPNGDGQAPIAAQIYTAPSRGKSLVFKELPHESLISALEYAGFSQERFLEG